MGTLAAARRYGLGAAVLTLGIVVVLGWHTGNTRLIQVHPSFVPMQYNTALGFLASGLGLLLLQAGQFRV